MRVDAVTVLPEYFAPLQLSLLGRAVERGSVELAVHDLRAVTTDRHRTVDDSPFGGGAGMVMQAEPWARTLEGLLEQGPAGVTPRLLVPSPSGRVLDQRFATELSHDPWLIFACGRYEGIDERVYDWAAEKMTVTPISIGDYVLFGGEVAAMVVLEAVVRLLPGVLGNADSLAEESHTDGLLEYPLYTKPATWRGHEVPPVLLSGNHAAIASWRGEQRLLRTAERRPDLLPADATVSVRQGLPTGLGQIEVRPAVAADAGELFTLQRACWLDEQLANPGVEIPALTETLADVRDWLSSWQTVVLRVDSRLVAAGRGRAEGQTWHVGRLMVAPDLRGRGLGRWLLETVEAMASRTDSSPEGGCTRFELFTGENSTDNLRMYRKAGYRPSRAEAPAGAVLLSKRR